MTKRALIRRIGLFLCRGWAQQFVYRWHDAISPDSPPSAFDDLDLLPCDISFDFTLRGSHRGLNALGTSHNNCPCFFFFLEFANTISIARSGAGEKYVSGRAVAVLVLIPKETKQSQCFTDTPPGSKV